MTRRKGTLSGRLGLILEITVRCAKLMREYLINMNELTYAYDEFEWVSWTLICGLLKSVLVVEPLISRESLFSKIVITSSPHDSLYIKQNEGHTQQLSHHSLFTDPSETAHT